MSRCMIEGLTVPVPIGDSLPAIYRDLDDNVQRLTQAFDEVIAPVWMVLDSIDAYFDPALAPRDFVLMLAEWVGLVVDDNWRDDQVRRLVADAVEAYRWRGTRRGVVALVEAYAGVIPVVTESGGTTWSRENDSAAPGSANPTVRVDIELPAGADEDLPRLTRLITESVPAHVAVTVEIVRTATS